MNMHTKKIKSLRNNEQGFASMVIALILIIILGLLTVGFAQLARREQQNALQKQLSTQAFYAAESGINDMVKVIQQAFNNPSTAIPSLATLQSVRPNQCLEKQGVVGLPSNNIDPSTATSYSCVLLNLQPPVLTWSGVSPGADESATFSTTGALNRLTVYWATDNHQTTPRVVCASGCFPPAARWGSPAVLQVSITPLNSITRASMIAETFTVYLYPSKGGGLVAYDPNNQGQIINASNCNGVGTYPCSVTIAGIPGAANEQYLVHILDYYDVSNIAIGNALGGPTGTQPLNFVGGQAQIDVTGKARYVLKRIQVASPLTPPEKYPGPPYVVQGQNICKRLQTEPTITNPNGTDFIGTNDSLVNAPSTDPCDLSL